MAEAAVHSLEDDTYFLLKLLCKRFWGKHDDGKREIYKHHKIKIPPINGPYKQTSVSYTAIDLGPDLNRLFPEESPNLMLRQDYVDINKHIRKQEKIPGCEALVITGQPGIGKSSCLYYLLIERVLEGKVTAWNPTNSRIYLLLGQDQVKVYTGDAYNLALYDYPHAWALSDSNEEVTTPHPRLTCAHSRFLVIQASRSVESDRGWCKQRRGELVVMKPWSWDELFVGGTRFERDIPFSKLKQAFTLCGGSARQCFRFARNEEEMVAWEKEIPKLLESYSNLSMVAGIIWMSNKYNNTPLSSLIFCIIPQTNRFPVSSLVSARVGKYLVKTLEKQDPGEFKRLYEVFRTFPETHYAAEWLMEAREAGDNEVANYKVEFTL